MVYLGALLIFLTGYLAGSMDRRSARRAQSPELTLSEEWAAKQLRH